MSEVKQYRKRPVLIQAMFVESYLSLPDVAAWVNIHGGTMTYKQIEPGPAFGEIHTLEGVMRVDVHDFVIRGVEGEFYPCKPGIFWATYDEEPDGV